MRTGRARSGIGKCGEIGVYDGDNGRSSFSEKSSDVIDDEIRHFRFLAQGAAPHRRSDLEAPRFVGDFAKERKRLPGGKQQKQQQQFDTGRRDRARLPRSSGHRRIESALGFRSAG